MALKDFSESELELWIENRFHAEIQGITEFSKEMKEYKQLLVSNLKETKELLELFQSAKAFLRVMKVFERIAVWFSKIAVFLALLWALWMYVIMAAIKQIKGTVQ